MTEKTNEETDEISTLDEREMDSLFGSEVNAVEVVDADFAEQQRLYEAELAEQQRLYEVELAEQERLYEERYRTHNKLLQEVNNCNASSNKTVQSLLTEIKKSQQRLEEAIKQLAIKTNEYDESNTQHVNQLEAITLILNEKVLENDTLKQQMKDEQTEQTRRMQDQTKEHEKLSSRYEQLSRMKEKLEQLIESQEIKHQEMVQQSEQYVERLKLENQKLQTKYDEQSNIIEQYISKTKQYKSLIQELKTHHSSQYLKEHSEQIQKLREENNTLRMEVSSCDQSFEDRIKGLSEQLLQARVKIENESASKTYIESELQKCNSSLKECREELRVLKSQNASNMWLGSMQLGLLDSQLKLSSLRDYQLALSSLGDHNCAPRKPIVPYYVL